MFYKPFTEATTAEIFRSVKGREINHNTVSRQMSLHVKHVYCCNRRWLTVDLQLYDRHNTTAAV